MSNIKTIYAFWFGNLYYQTKLEWKIEIKKSTFNNMAFNFMFFLPYKRRAFDCLNKNAAVSKHSCCGMQLQM